MKLAVLALAAACSGPVYLPVPAQPPPPLDPIAPAIELPIHAEGMYGALFDHDPRLERVCEELAFLIDHGGAASIDLATAVLRMHGIVEPPQRVVSGKLDADLEPQFGADLDHSNTVVGRGMSATTAVGILIFRPNIEIAAFPRSITASAILHFTLDPALTKPIATVSDATASVRVPISDAQVTVPCDRAGERYVTIEATDPRHATTPMVIFPVYCKLAAPSHLEAEPLVNLDGIEPGGVGRRLASILAHERGAPSLNLDPRFEQAAEAYARDRSEGRETDRATLMREAGLLAPATSWTTFHVDSLASAINRVVSSPDQLRKLRDSERTAFGVGAVQVPDG
ncbi:hypothetical protein BH11MYX1_BH11MYX1_01860 [soil metagenome]